MSISLITNTAGKDILSQKYIPTRSSIIWGAKRVKKCLENDKDFKKGEDLKERKKDLKQGEIDLKSRKRLQN